MGRARQSSVATASPRHQRTHARERAQPDPFAATFGGGRGLDATGRAQRAREALIPQPITTVYPSGETTTCYYENNDEEAGVLHREDGPALVTVNPDGWVSEEWYCHGQTHRVGAPAIIETSAYANPPLRYEYYYFEDVLHRDDGPALYAPSGDGNHVVEYRQHGQLHRTNGPAYVETDANGKVIEQKWYENGVLMRWPTLADTSKL